MELFAESLRISAFAPAFADYRRTPVEDWWREATGGDPEQVNRSSVAPSPQVIAEGPYGDGQRLSLAATPGRVDWILSHPVPSSHGWPTVGEWPTCIDQLVTLGSNWLRSIPPTSRLAFAGAVVAIMQDRNAAYRAIESATVDFGLRIPAGATDFLLQFNQAIPSRLGPAGIVLNRLSRWGSALLKPLTLKLTVVPGSPISVTNDDSAAREITSLRIEFDFNTSPEWTGTLEPEQAVALLEELTRTAVDYIAERVML